MNSVKIVKYMHWNKEEYYKTITEEMLKEKYYSGFEVIKNCDGYKIFIDVDISNNLDNEDIFINIYFDLLTVLQKSEFKNFKIFKNKRLDKKNNNYKYSFHVIIMDSWYHCTVCIGKKVEQLFNNSNVEIDSSVYKNKNIFRLPYTCKFKESDKYYDKNDILKEININETTRFKIIDYDRPKDYLDYYVTFNNYNIEISKICTEKPKSTINNNNIISNFCKVLPVKQNNKIDYNILVDTVYKIPDEKIKKYESWRNIIWAIADTAYNNNYDGLCLAIEISKNKNFKNDEEVIDLYNKYDYTKENKPTFGTLKEYSKHNYNNILFNNWEEVQVFIKNTIFDNLMQIELFSKSLKNVIKIVNFNKLLIFINTKDDIWFYPEKRGCLPTLLFSYYNDKQNEITINLESLILNNKHFRNGLEIYNKITFAPNMNIANTYNLWNNFQSTPIVNYNIDIIKPLLDAIMDIWCNNEQIKYDFIMNWLKHILTENTKTKRCIVLYSEVQQIGKGIIIGFLSKYLFGRKYSLSIAGIDSLIRKFNEHLMGRSFINVDELTSIENISYKGAFDILKKKITDDVINIEIKNGKCFDFDDVSNYIFTTNHKNSVKIEKNDARYVCFECNPKFRGNVKYFNELQKTLNQNTANHFHTYLLNYKTNVDIRNCKIKSELYDEMILSSGNSCIRFFDYFDNNKDLDNIKIYINEKKEISFKNIYNLYISWCDENKETVLNSTTFKNNSLEKYKKKRYTDGYRYILD
jgi:hypothetical protein